jgi:iron complex outermembrane receptor protein
LQFVSKYLSFLLVGSLGSGLSGGGFGLGTASAQPAPPSDTPPPPATDTPPPPASTVEAPPADSSPAPSAAADTVTITGTVRSPDLEAPLSGAKISIENTNISVTTDESGRFTLNAPPGRITIRADFNGFRSVQREVSMSAGKSADIDFPLALDQLLTEVVVVVGSRTPRTNVETTAPVDVVTAEEISHVGKAESGRILSTLAPSYYAVQQTVADGTDHTDPAALRGLGPDQVLVLVNGKRRHKSALLNVNGTFGRGAVGTDLNAIPSGSIKRIEILRDGAASQYGSDAIAGVINIVTKDYTDLLDVNAMTGVTGSNDGAMVKGSANYGFKIGQKGFLNVTGEFLKKDPTNRAGTYTGAIFSNDPAVDQMMINQVPGGRDAFKMKIGEASSEEGMGAYNLELPIDAASTFYSFGDVSHRTGSGAGFRRFPVATTQVVTAFYPNGFLPEIHSNINDLGVTLGVRRKGDWNIDFSVTHGQSSFQFIVDRTNNASYGTASPTTFDSGTLSAQETLADFDLLRKVDTGGVLKNLALVTGSEVRTENYRIKAGQLESYDDGNPKFFPNDPPFRIPGAQLFPGFQPANEVDRNRFNVGVYAGVEAEVIKGLNVDLGGRYENYDDFGDSWTGKAAARIPLGKMLAVRGAVSTGFRAPSLQQLWFSNVSTQFLMNNSTGLLEPNQVLTENNANPITKKFGISQLTQEESTNASGGITFRPFENLSITADGYFVRMKNRITLTNQFSTADPNVAALLQEFNLPGVTKIVFFANAVDTDTTGADIVADYAVDTGAGTVVLSGAANFSKTVVQRVNLPPGLRAALPGVSEAALNDIFFDRLAKNRLEDSVPHQKGNAAIRYNYKQLSALVRANYFGKVRYKPDAVNGSFVNDELFRAKVLFDADIGYQFTKTLQLVIGADNIFNTFPDQNTKAGNLASGQFVYNRNVTQFGMNGGFYYTKLELTFF